MPSRQASFDQGNGKEAVLQASLDSVVGLLKASEAQSERLARAFGEARAEHQAEIWGVGRLARRGGGRKLVGLWLLQIK